MVGDPESPSWRPRSSKRWQRDDPASNRRSGVPAVEIELGRDVRVRTATWATGFGPAAARPQTRGAIAEGPYGGWLTSRDAAAKLGVSDRQIRKLIKTGVLVSE